MNLHTKTTAFNADTLTPVGIFLSLRNHFTKIALLESNDYKDRSDSKSFIGFNPIAEIKVANCILSFTVDNQLIDSQVILPTTDLSGLIAKMIHYFEMDENQPIYNGYFGAFSFEFAYLIEQHISKKESDLDFPDLQLFLYEYLIVIDHFQNESFIIQNSFSPIIETVPKVLDLLKIKTTTSFYFEKIGTEKSSLSDHDFRHLVKIAKEECAKGNVFQMVYSRDFSQNYFGDDFEVYRALRKLNPSPYLFYFDFETHRIMGSSPEAQLKIHQGQAEIHPIAGTVRKSGDEIQDNQSIQFLINDKKENAEHTMLVDLARNDLSKNCSQVRVEKYKEIQHFSHVIHLVSKVKAHMNNSSQFVQLFSDTFPAGTLSGTPKPKALELIAKHETKTRDYYGGAIGSISFNGNVNMAIIIRSILSQNNTLHYRAGAGVVIHSDEESELQEVNNKLSAVRKALDVAEHLTLKKNENSRY